MTRAQPWLLLTFCLLFGSGVGLAWAQDSATNSQAPRRPVYQLRTLRVGETYETIRFRSETGEAWLAVASDEGNAWVAIGEIEPPPTGDYEVQMTETKPGNYTVLRIDQQSGKTWSMTAKRQWKAIDEPQQEASPPK